MGDDGDANTVKYLIKLPSFIHAYQVHNTQKPKGCRIGPDQTTHRAPAQPQTTRKGPQRPADSQARYGIVDLRDSAFLVRYQGSYMVVAVYGT